MASFNPEDLPPRRLAGLLLAMIAVLSAPAFLRPLLNDMGIYSAIASKMLHGGTLYVDAMDTKPPMVFLHYALVFLATGGVHPAAVKVTGLMGLFVSAWAVRGIHREAFPGSRRSAWAAVLFVLASFAGEGQDFVSPNTELLASPFLALSLWCLVRDGLAFSRARLALAGALVGIAFLYRFQSGAPLAAYFATVLVRGRELRHVVPRLFWLGAGFLVPLAAFAGWYVATDRLDAVRFFLEHEGYYLRGSHPDWRDVATRAGSLALGQAPFLALGGIGIAAVAREGRLRPGPLLLLAHLAISAGTLAISGRFYGHYWLPSIAPLALFAAEGLAPADPCAATAPAGGRAVRAFVRIAPALAAASALAFLAWNAAYFARTAGPDAPYPRLAAEVASRTLPDDRVFNWSLEPNVALYVDRPYATSFWANDFLTGRFPGTIHRKAGATAESASADAVAELWPVLMRELEADPPAAIVDDTPERSGFTLDRYPPLRAFVEARYEPCRVVDGLCVYWRKPS